MKLGVEGIEIGGGGIGNGWGKVVMRGEGEIFGGEENVVAGKGDGICNLVCLLGDDLLNII